MVGKSIKLAVTIKLAISPTPPVPEPIANLNSSLTNEQHSPDQVPNIKPASAIITIEKSSCKKLADGNIGNSNSDITKASAPITAVPTNDLVKLFSAIKIRPFKFIGA